MANQTNGNPIIYDGTTGASWTGIKFVKLVQWIDDNADIADDDTLVFTVNGVTFTGKYQIDADDVSLKGLVAYQFGPFDNGVPWQDFTLTTMTHGALVIWVD